jgi:modulator of FtsH protease HflK
MARIVRRIVWSALLLLAVFHALSGFYVLGPGEQAIVERFGRPTNSNAPAASGLHYALPWPIDTVRRVSTTRVRRLALGYRGQTDPEAILWTNIVYEDERPMLTGHRVRTAGGMPGRGASEHMHVLVNARVFVHYRVTTPSAYLYACQQPEEMLGAMAERLLRQQVARRELFPMLSTERDSLEQDMGAALQEQATPLGIQVTGVEIRDIHPPAPVAGAFRDVVSAMEDYETLVDHGKGYRIDTVQKAKTRAQEVRAAALGHGKRLIARHTSRAEALKDRLAAYRAHPDIARTQLILDTLGRALKDVRKVIVPGPGRGALGELWLIDNASGVAPRGPIVPRPSLPGPAPRMPAIPEKEL